MNGLPAFPDAASASAELGRQIAAKFGADPAIADSFEFQTLDCPHAAGGGKGKVLLALPIKPAGGAALPTDGVLAVYYGDLPLHLTHYADGSARR